MAIGVLITAKKKVVHIVGQFSFNNENLPQILDFLSIIWQCRAHIPIWQQSGVAMWVSTFWTPRRFTF